jgi:predicted homoserine dehydrogenase-like protein
MIMVDTALAERHRAGRPIRVGMVGAGFMAKAIANQIINSVPGMDLAVIANRNLENARRCYGYAGVNNVREVRDTSEIERAVREGVPAITTDALALARAEGIDAVLEVTGAVEFSSNVALETMEARKHLILMNAELDGTVGPLLKIYADKAGVVFTNVDGDQPGVQMNLYRFVRSIGMRPLLCGNIKGLQDPYRTPETQKAFALRWGQRPEMVTSFADGTKVSFEQAIVANATGMTVAKRACYGFEHAGHVDELTTRFDIDELRSLGGIVDYVVGAKPAPGVFILAEQHDPKHRHYLNLYKLGEGPLYSFYTPWHLCHFEVPFTIARAVIFGDATIVAAGAPKVEVVTIAKRDLRAGQIIDGIGGFHIFGVCERADVTARERLLPIGVAEGCRLIRDIPKDQAITYDDVEVPQGRTIDRLRAAQIEHFRLEPSIAAV